MQRGGAAVLTWRQRAIVSEGRSNGRGEAASAGYFTNGLRKFHSVKMSGMSGEMPSRALISGMEKGESFAQLKWRLMCDDVGERWRSLRRLLAINGDSTKLWLRLGWEKAAL
ncbi:hypothetical protein M5K25_022591 [Dendrobium thyrsiflorum]|uniref:Uncharacterized protein n=1 Tax=Dendrobium thyrsiflorum TaxID=117978 RepID=A0ABD0U6H0_DENTH